MSGETVLRIQPGESVDAFTRRIADTAPPLAPALAARLRTLLPATQAPARPAARHTRTAA
ncbi:hypothetical protein ABT124_03215 [Streptomyces sp. NPDC001982]|uniref:hypothetical protein n=1 Tax=Streptomyces sp. NPDC001982 TaxID=3154405 RepID=UPI00331F3AD4